jgi:hypothetical protein
LRLGPTEIRGPDAACFHIVTAVSQGQERSAQALLSSSSGRVVTMRRPNSTRTRASTSSSLSRANFKLKAHRRWGSRNRQRQGTTTSTPRGCSALSLAPIRPLALWALVLPPSWPLARWNVRLASGHKVSAVNLNLNLNLKGEYASPMGPSDTATVTDIPLRVRVASSARWSSSQWTLRATVPAAATRTLPFSKFRAGCSSRRLLVVAGGCPGPPLPAHASGGRGY